MALLVISFTGFSQKDTLSYAQQFETIADELDSVSIFNLIDSLLNLELSPSNELNIRMGFTTSITSTGRDFGIDQSGFAPGVSYYHKSGMYADISGYWNSGTTPAYDPTVLSVGYLSDINKTKLSYSFDAERWFFNLNDSSINPLSYAMSTSLSYTEKLWFASVDYSFLFGQELAHRIIFNLSGDIDLGKWWMFKSIKLYPSVSSMIGNSEIVLLRITNRQVNELAADRITQLSNVSRLDEDQRSFLIGVTARAFRQGFIDRQERNQLLFTLRNAGSLSPENQEILQRIVADGYEVNEYVSSDVFGVLNYAFTLPLALATDRWLFMLSYTYTLPIQFPGEFIEASPVGFFGSTISYRIPFK